MNEAGEEGKKNTGGDRVEERRKHIPGHTGFFFSVTRSLCNQLILLWSILPQDRMKRDCVNRMKSSLNANVVNHRSPKKAKDL